MAAWPSSAAGWVDRIQKRNWLKSAENERSCRSPVGLLRLSIID